MIKKLSDDGLIVYEPYKGVVLTGKGRAKAQKVLGKLREESKKRHVPSSFFAPVYAGLGNAEMAFASLEKAFQEHDDRVAYYMMDSAFASLRSDPRSISLLRRMNLPVKGNK